MPNAPTVEFQQNGKQIAQPFYIVDQNGNPISSTNALNVSATVTPAANQRVNAQAGDFVAGSVVDLATQLTLLQGAITSNKMATKAATGDMYVEDIEAANYVAGSTPPSTTNAGSDTSYTFSSQVNRVILQNNTSANVNYAFDTAASAGSLVLAPGYTLVYPKKCTVLHLYTAAAQNINGSSAGNIIVLGAL